MNSRINDRLLETLTLKKTNDTGITLKSSNTNIHEYILPSSVGTDGQVLKIESIDSNKATLTWSAGGGGFSGGNASTITLANETIDSDCFVIFSNNPTGEQPLKTNNDTNNAIKFNSTNGTLTTSTFNGNLTGNATTATNLSNVVPISLGGTNATSASAARSALGVDAAGTDNSTNLMLSSVTGNYLTLDEDNQILTAGVVPITLGGTNATSASTARTALGVDAAGTDNSTNVMLSSVAGNYLTLDEDNQILTSGIVPISLGGTNATTASAARTALGVDAVGTDNSTDLMLSSVAGNYLTLDEDNQILTAGVVPISLGGTGVSITDDNSKAIARDSSHLNVQKDVGFVEADKTKLNTIEDGANVTNSTSVSAAGALMNTDNSKKIVDDIIIGEDNTDLMVVNSNIETNGYLKKASRFTPVTKLNSTLETFTFVNVNSNTALGLIPIEHLDGIDGGTPPHIDTLVKIDNIKDMTNILVLFKTGISYSTTNMFVAILLIKRLYNSSGSMITGVGVGNSGNIIVGTASDGTDVSGNNTTDAFFDGSIGYSWSNATYDTTDASGNIYYGGGVRAEDDVLKNLNGQFLDTNITEGVDDVVGVSYHMAFKPLWFLNAILNINSPRDTTNITTGEPDRSNVATIITLIPY
jgi:hypothetical protein